MSQRPRTMLTRALHSAFLAACLTTGGVSAHNDAQARIRGQYTNAPTPFTTLPSRSAPAPATDARALEVRENLAPAVRGLTAGERRLAQTLFGDKISLDDVRIVLFAHDDDARFNTATSGDANTLRIYNSKHYSDDYSGEANAALFGSFVNQLAGLVQQRSRAWSANDGESGDLYTLDDRRFGDYGYAQQRAILEDYALRFLHPARTTYWLAKTYNGDSSITDPHLIEMVERAFPSTREARIAFQGIETRALTANEVRAIRMIFGDQFDTEGVRVHLCPRMFRDVAGAVSGAHDVYFYGRNRMADYTTGTPSQQAIFLHEMVHIWQFQTNRRYTVEVNDLYQYTIEDGARFEDYNIEQQAAMIEDYALAYMSPQGRVRWLRDKYSDDEIPARMAMVARTVEAHFPAARTVRLAAEEAEAAKEAAKHIPPPPAPDTAAADETPAAATTDSNAEVTAADTATNDAEDLPPPPQPTPVERTVLPFVSYKLDIPAPTFPRPAKITFRR